MSWVHTGKVNAFNYCGLDHQLALDHGIRLPAQYNRNIQLTRQSLLMLASLNDYDQAQVLKEIDHVIRYPGTPHSVRHSLNPFRRVYRTRHPFQSYHYLIEYKTTPAGEIVIDDILFDQRMVGRQGIASAERSMLYEVQRLKPLNYDGPKSRKDVTALQGAWGEQEAVVKIATEHAAVNGMQNDLTKAVWLMGAHAHAAYSSDGISAYTLFHNPSDNFFLDSVECVFDKRKGTKSHNAQHLAAILAQRQQQGKATKWVVHSQGAIIFCAALEHYRIHYRAPLNHQQLKVHGSGANLNRLAMVAKSLGVTVHDPSNNPYDLVPNLAGGNDLSPSGLVRSLHFCARVFGSDVGASPHTLPYLGLETYKTQLRMLGRHRKADSVQNYINRHAS